MLGRWLTLIIVFLVLPVTLLAIPSWNRVTLHQTETADITATIAALKGVVRKGKEIVSAYPSPTTFTTTILGTESSPVLFASLQSRLRELANRQGLEVYQSSNLPVEALNPGLEKAIVRLELAGSASLIARFIFDIENAEPRLFIDTLDLRSGEQDGVDAQTEPQISANIQVWGLIAKAKVP